MIVHGDPEESGGAAAGPLAGECVPHEGECTAVERMCDGASLAQTARRRRADERKARPVCPLSARLCDAGDGGGSGGGGRSHGRSFSPGPLLLYFSDLGLGFRFQLCTVKRFEIDSFGHFFSQTRSTT
jgi:hypothetical protein